MNIETFTGLNTLVAKSSQFTTVCTVLRTSDLAKVAIQENRTRHRQKEKSTENRNSNCITVNITSDWLLTLNLVMRGVDSWTCKTDYCNVLNDLNKLAK